MLRGARVLLEDFRESREGGKRLSATETKEERFLRKNGCKTALYQHHGPELSVFEERARKKETKRISEVAD